MYAAPSLRRNLRTTYAFLPVLYAVHTSQATPGIGADKAIEHKAAVIAVGENATFISQHYRQASCVHRPAGGAAGPGQRARRISADMRSHPAAASARLLCSAPVLSIRVLPCRISRRLIRSGEQIAAGTGRRDEGTAFRFADQPNLANAPRPEAFDTHVLVS